MESVTGKLLDLTCGSLSWKEDHKKTREKKRKIFETYLHELREGN